MASSGREDVVGSISCSPCRKRGAGPNQWRRPMAELPPPPKGMVLTHFIVSDDVERSRRFCTEILGGRVVFGPVPVNVELANSLPGDWGGYWGKQGRGRGRARPPARRPAVCCCRLERRRPAPQPAGRTPGRPASALSAAAETYANISSRASWPVRRGQHRNSGCSGATDRSGDTASPRLGPATPPEGSQ
jgi:hypothetical protein